MFSFPGAYWLGLIMFTFLGIVTLAKRKISFDEMFTLLRGMPVIWGFLIYVLSYVGLTVYHGDSYKSLWEVVPFLLAPLILVGIVRNEPSTKNFWVGCAVGSVLACAIGLYQIYVLGVERAYGFRNPILFGDTAIVLGTGALVGLFYGRAVFKSPSTKIFLLLGGLAGLFTSLLSGSKGGWLSLLMIIALLANTLTRSMHYLKRVAVIFGCLLILAAVVHFIPKLPVVSRIVSAYHGTIEWMQTGRVTEGSASIRLESFKAGLIAGSQSPIVGLGVQGEQLAYKQAVDAGLIRKEMIELNVVDNDFISRFSRHGLLGMLGIIAVHFGVFLTFWRYRSAENGMAKALSSMGILLVLFYLEFGLTVSIFGTSIFRTMYASWSILLAGLLLSERAQLKSASPVS